METPARAAANPLLLQEPEEVCYRAGAKIPGPADIEGSGLDGGAPDRSAGQRVLERMLNPETGLNFEASLDIVRDPEPQSNGGLRGGFFPLSGADFIKARFAL